MKVVGVAVWGLGGHASRRILPALNAIKNLSLIGVCSRSTETVEELSQYWGCLGWTDPSEMLSHPSVDVVYIATPIGVHFQMAKQALNSGKHVWCEKPLTCSYDDAQELVLLARKRGKTLIEAFMYLYHPQFAVVQKFVTSRHVHSITCKFGLPVLDNPGFRNNPDLCGGALWDVASYTVSAALALFPECHITTIFSRIFTKGDSPVDTDGCAILQSSNGETMHLQWGVGLGYRNEIEIWAQDGSLFTDKIFSKPEDYQPIYKLRDQYGSESFDYGNVSEQFNNMFQRLSRTLESSTEAEFEYECTLRRAKIMNEIVQLAKVKE